MYDYHYSRPNLHRILSVLVLLDYTLDVVDFVTDFPQSPWVALQSMDDLVSSFTMYLQI